MDGNRRFAKKCQLENVSLGHKKGIEKFNRVCIWDVIYKNRVLGGTQEFNPQISSWFFVPGGFRLRWLRIWWLKLDPTTCSACSGRSAYGSFEKFHFRYSAWEKFNFAIKMLGETSWTLFWKDLVEMTPNKEVVMKIVKHVENVISMFRLF